MLASSVVPNAFPNGGRHLGGEVKAQPDPRGSIVWAKGCWRLLVKLPVRTHAGVAGSILGHSGEAANDVSLSH